MTLLRVNCGDWIYPSRDSTAPVQYPIDEPLVAEIFRPAASAGKPVYSSKRIETHLTGPRYLKLEVDEKLSVLHLIALKNHQEEDFVQEIGAALVYELENLPRVSGPPNPDDSNECAIFFARAILMAHLAMQPLVTNIVFRKATIPEIEALGRW